MSSPRIGPVFGRGNENRDGVDEGAAGFDNLLHIPLGGHFGANRQVADDHIRFRVFQDFDDVRRGAGGLGDDLCQVLAESIVGHPADDRGVQMRHFAEFVGVVRLSEDGFGEVFANLGDVDIDSNCEFNIPDVVTAQVDVHQAGDGGLIWGVFVIFNALNER